MKKSVLIIGGGIAGLSAASALLRLGCKVTVLEAKGRLGGRIYTLRDGNLTSTGDNLAHRSITPRAA